MLESFGRYRRAGVRLGLGTDCVPQDMIVVTGWAASLSKIADRNVNSATAADVLRAATIGGADALGRPDLGRIQPGAKADFLIVRPSSLRLGPVDDPIRNLVYLGSQHDIEQVWAGGRRVVERGVVAGVDEGAVLRHMQAHMDRQRARFLEVGLDRGVDPFPPSLPTWSERPLPDVTVP
jgi:cytosine/adenosine deaminase-related metal-dependent hydrolase